MNDGAVLEGANGFLFVPNGSNRVIDQIEGRLPLSGNELLELAFVHNARSLAASSQLCCRYAHAVVPDKEVVMRRHLPPFVLVGKFGARPIAQYVASDASCIWRPFYRPEMLDDLASAGVQVFARLDSHWTHRGAHAYLEAFLASVAPNHAEAFANLAFREFASTQMGDLGVKVDAAAEEIVVVAPAKQTAELRFANRIQNTGSTKYFVNRSAPVHERVVVMHDRAGLWLQPTLAELFRETLFFHDETFDVDFFGRFQPSSIYVFQTERFFRRVPKCFGDILASVEQQEGKKRAEARFRPFINELLAHGDAGQRLRFGSLLSSA